MTKRKLYFIHKGKRYECGTVVVFYDDYFKNTYERVFLCYIPDSDYYTLQQKEGGAWIGMPGVDFMNKIVEVNDEICKPIRDSFIKGTSSSCKKISFNNLKSYKLLFYLILLLVCVACPPLSILLILLMILL